MRQADGADAPDLLALFDIAELKKYMTDEELAVLIRRAAPRILPLTLPAPPAPRMAPPLRPPRAAEEKK